MIYELLVGQTPFLHPNATQMSMFRAIVRNNDISFKTRDGYVVPEAEELINSLLIKSPIDRLGSLGRGIDDIRRQPWFKGILLNGSKLLNKQIEAPWVPAIKDPMDTSHFTPYDDEEVLERSRQLQEPNKTTEIFADF